MNWLPTDASIFLGGFLAAAIGMVATGFLREAGKELWALMRKKWFPLPPPPPEDVQIDLQFKPTIYKQEDCLWAQHESVARYKGEGYTFYPHPSNGGRCVLGYDKDQSFLMVKPNASKIV